MLEIKSVFNSIVASIIIGMILKVWSKVRFSRVGGDKCSLDFYFSLKSKLSILICFFVVTEICLVILAYLGNPAVVANFYSYFLTSVLVVFGSLVILNSSSESIIRLFADIGFAGLDKSMEHGVSPDESLKMCHDSFKFLGVGSHKLTSSPEFERCVERCAQHGEPMKFILCNPTSIALDAIEAETGEASGTYRARIRQSLKAIDEYKRKGNDIKVKLYNRNDKNLFPTFRVFLMNNSMCIFSHQLFGRKGKEGRNLPQYILDKNLSDSDVVGTYSAFNMVFNKLWETAEEYEDLSEFYDS